MAPHCRVPSPRVTELPTRVVTITQVLMPRPGQPGVLTGGLQLLVGTSLGGMVAYDSATPGWPVGEALTGRRGSWPAVSAQAEDVQSPVAGGIAVAAWDGAGGV